MPRLSKVALSLALLLLLAQSAAPSFAASFREQRNELKRASTFLRAAERLAKADRREDAREAYDKAREIVEAVSSELDEKAKRSFERTKEELANTHAALTKLGVDLPSFESPEASMASGEDRGRFNRDQVSFVRQVAPLLTAKCGRCHVDGSRGGFSLATYNNLMRGTQDGRVLVPGEGTGGVMMDLIESGDMPRGGLTVSPEEMTMLSRWITQGARFDGDNPDANLSQLRAGSAPPAADPEPDAPAPRVTTPTGKETVSFALDVAPILVKSCNNCHVLDDRGNLEFATFRQLLGGGVVVPGKPGESSLVRRLRGDDTPRMPMNAPPLPAEEIEKIATWVREGASFDGVRAEDSLQRTTAVVTARNATSEELNALRVERTKANWRLAIPDEPMESVTTERFLVAGSLPRQKLEQASAAAEAAADQALGLFGGQSGEPLGKSRFTLFVFDHGIDYGEFAQMVEKREVPGDLTGHARHDPVDPYACVLIDREAEEINPTSVAQQVASLYVSEKSQGRAPAWFANGAGRVAAAKAAPKDPAVESWQTSFPASLRDMQEPDDFMTGRMPPQAAGVVGYQYVKAMMRNRRAFDRLMNALEEGEAFGAAFQKQYKASPREIAEKWRDSLLGRR